MLDAVDAALVRALQGDGRATYQALADEVGLSRTAVRSRVKQLVDTGAIRIVGVLHAGVLGKEVLGQVSLQMCGPVRPVLDELYAWGTVTFAAQTAGQFPAVAYLRVHDDAGLAHALAELRALPGIAATDVFRTESVVKDAYTSAGTLRDTVIDPLDWRLVRHLQSDGRASYATLARHVGLSQAAARSRVVRLLNAGVVHVTAVMEPSVIGSEEQLGFGVLCRGDAASLACRLADFSAVSFAATGFGRHDVIGTITATDRSLLAEVLEFIRADDAVNQVETWEYLNVTKEPHRDLVPAMSGDLPEEQE